MSAGQTAGDLAIVLHSHMPYVEGFGTYPFGEEWLFDAVVPPTCRCSRWRAT
jgi:1,4-alpha-glucan branching enzyme